MYRFCLAFMHSSTDPIQLCKKQANKKPLHYCSSKYYTRTKQSKPCKLTQHIHTKTHTKKRHKNYTHTQKYAHTQLRRTQRNTPSVKRHKNTHTHLQGTKAHKTPKLYNNTTFTYSTGSTGTMPCYRVYSRLQNIRSKTIELYIHNSEYT